MSRPRVLFVSKPIAPPFHDGAKCLVRDVATHVRSVTPRVLTTPGAPPLAGVEMEALYAGLGAFAPALADNARVLARLLAGRGDDAWHFVFAPNPASSSAGRVAKRVRRVPTVQTVASAPRSFDCVARLLFGDRIVALSSFTRARLVAGGADPARITVIPPAVPPLSVPDAEVRAAARSLGLEGADELVVYPGDVELSRGARVVADAVPRLLAARSRATIVFACRKKTPRAADAEARLAHELAPFGPRVRFVGEVASLPALLAAASVVAFPVDDLYGKVDLPIALLEALRLGVPIVVDGRGPLAEIASAVRLSSPDGGALADACARLLASADARADVAERGRAEVAARFAPEAVAAAYDALYADLLARR